MSRITTAGVLTQGVQCAFFEPCFCNSKYRHCRFLLLLLLLLCHTAAPWLPSTAAAALCRRRRLPFHVKYRSSALIVSEHSLPQIFMQCRYLSGRSNSGLHMAHGVRDLDAMTARPPLPPRALPDDIRIKLKLASRPADNVCPFPLLFAFLFFSPSEVPGSARRLT